MLTDAGGVRIGWIRVEGIFRSTHSCSACDHGASRCALEAVSSTTCQSIM